MSVQLGIVSTTGGRLNLRSQPSTHGAIRGKLAKGTAVEILDTIDDWLQVRFGSLEGFVHNDFVLVQDESFFDRRIKSLDSGVAVPSLAHEALVEQALRMLGEDIMVYDSLSEAQQRDCWGWNFRDDEDHLNHKDIVCADLVYICLKAAGVTTEWEVTEPPGTPFKTHHAANYFRPSELLREIALDAEWEPGDILIYWDGNLSENRLRHVNLYVGPFAGMDLDGFLYPANDPCDVVNASIDFRNRQNKEQGSRIRGVKKERCLQSAFGRDHVMRLRHVELAARTAVPSEVHSPQAVRIPQRDETAPIHDAAPMTVADDNFTVPFGQLTFDAEGMEVPGPFFSRKPHVPSSSSGVTIGRGYDMRDKSKQKIMADMAAAGISRDLAERFVNAGGLRGDDAKQFVRRQLVDVEITPRQQKDLFLMTYKDLEKDVIRICSKRDVMDRYGTTNWDLLHPAIQDVTVDLRYRGDYIPKTRRVIQEHIAANDLQAFTAVLNDEAYWCGKINVPRDRFKRRRDYLNMVLAEA